MNGAELPCRTSMGVQPADMNYKARSHEKNVPISTEGVDSRKCVEVFSC
jgi:hypothetical protein